MEPFKVRLTGTTSGTLNAVIVHIHLTDHLMPTNDDEPEEES